MVARSADLRSLTADATGRTPEQITAHQMSDDFADCACTGLIERIPGSFRYQLTQKGLQAAVAYTLAHDRILRPLARSAR